MPVQLAHFLIQDNDNKNDILTENAFISSLEKSGLLKEHSIR